MPDLKALTNLRKSNFVNKTGLSLDFLEKHKQYLENENYIIAIEPYATFEFIINYVQYTLGKSHKKEDFFE